jgi:hypothetical protein
MDPIGLVLMRKCFGNYIHIAGNSLLSSRIGFVLRSHFFAQRTRHIYQSRESTEAPPYSLPICQPAKLHFHHTRAGSLAVVPGSVCASTLCSILRHSFRRSSRRSCYAEYQDHSPELVVREETTGNVLFCETIYIYIYISYCRALRW